MKVMFKGLVILSLMFVQSGCSYASDAATSKMAYVESGDFTMGHVPEDEELIIFFLDTRPHLVNLKGYHIDKYEVTNEKYEKCVSANACKSAEGFGVTQKKC